MVSGLLSGKYEESITFDASDHRSYDRNGEAFDKGETFSGVPFDIGVSAARKVAALMSEGASTVQLALCWIVDQPGASVVISGACSPDQARANAWAGSLSPLPQPQLDALECIYNERISEHVHSGWWASARAVDRVLMRRTSKLGCPLEVRLDEAGRQP